MIATEILMSYFPSEKSPPIIVNITKLISDRRLRFAFNVSQEAQQIIKDQESTFKVALDLMKKANDPDDDW